jgi:hypothetical protein
MTVKDLVNPEFLAWLDRVKGGPGPIRPDKQDYDPSADPESMTDAQAAQQYRLACARKLMRLWEEWKASSN